MRRSYSTLEINMNMCADLCNDDRALYAELESLLASHNRPSAFLDRPAIEGVADSLLANPTMRWIGRRIGAYRIVAEIARGGMGEVYLATRDDGHYEKEVAIKLIRTGYSSEFMLRRLRLNDRFSQASTIRISPAFSMGALPRRASPIW